MDMFDASKSLVFTVYNAFLAIAFIVLKLINSKTMLGHVFTRKRAPHLTYFFKLLCCPNEASSGLCTFQPACIGLETVSYALQLL